MITKLEDALKHLKNHEDTGNYTSLYAALKLVIEANKKEPTNIDPLIRSLSFTVLEPLYIQIEKHLEDLQPNEPSVKEKMGQVIFVDFAKRKRAA